MSTESVLRKSWEIFQKHWQFLALVALIGFGVTVLLGALITGSVLGGLGGILVGREVESLTATTLLTGAGLASLGVGTLALILLLPWLIGASVHAAKLALAGSAATSAWAPYQASWKQYLTYLPLSIVMGIALIVGFSLLLIPGIILAVLLGLAPIVVAYENASVGDALKQAWRLGLAHFWTILLALAVVSAVAMIASLLAAPVPALGTYVSSLFAVVGAIPLAVIYTETK